MPDVCGVGGGGVDGEGFGEGGPRWGVGCGGKENDGAVVWDICEIIGGRGWGCHGVEYELVLRMGVPSGKGEVEGMPVAC